MKKRIIIIILFIFLLWKFSFGIKERIIEEIRQGMLTITIPLFAFTEENVIWNTTEEAIGSVLTDTLPLFSFGLSQNQHILTTEDENTYKLILQAEGRDENHSEEEEVLDMENALLEENQKVSENQVHEEVKEEKEEEIQQQFLPGEKKVEYNWDEFRDYEKLFSTFYAIDSNTMIGEDQLNLKELQGRNMQIDRQMGDPQILIYHTHSQEAFADSIAGDSSTTIMGAGERLAEILEQTYGYSVLHHTGEYDVEVRDEAYTKSLPSIEKILQENPSIQVVIDLHRDEVKEDRKLLVDINGKPAAQVMFFNGLSRTKKTGDIAYLENPYQADNLAFSFQMQVKCNEYYPGFTRKIYLKGYRYNMHIKPKTLLVELGAQTNTVEEITNALEPLAHVLSMVLQ